MEKEELQQIRDKVQELSDRYGSIKIIGLECLDDDGCTEINGCKILVNEGEYQLNFLIYGIDDIKKFEKALDDNYQFLNILLGFYNSKCAYLILQPLSYSAIIAAQNRLEKSNIEVEMIFENETIVANIGKLKPNSFPNLIYDSLQGIKSNNAYLLTLEPINRFNLTNINQILLDISNSILFDLEYSYGFALKTIKTESFIRDGFIYTQNAKPIPQAKIELIYKNYNLDLLEYYYTSEFVSYLPFKYLCFYQILEYLLDKSAFLSAKKFITNRIKQPDYHIQKDKYIEQIVNLIRYENLKSTTDLIKIQRVLVQYTSRKEIEEFIKSTFLKKHFERETILKCGDDLVLPPISSDGDKQFYESVAQRIYRVRCSIVHSNPDFDKKHAIPFVSSQKNLKILRYEIELIQMIAKSIIVNESE